MLIKACLNGARTRNEHPALPLTATELATAAEDAVRAGAGAIHMHPRDAQGQQSLASEVIGAAVAAVRAACPNLPVGVSTLFSIVPDVQQRDLIIASWQERPDFASVNIGEPGTDELCTTLLAAGIGIEAGIDSPESARQYIDSAAFGKSLRILIEPDDSAQGAPAVLEVVAAIEAVLDAAGDQTPRLLHSGGISGWGVIDAAIARGYDTRVGLEDLLILPDGSTARDNAQLVAEVYRRMQASI